MTLEKHHFERLILVESFEVEMEMLHPGTLELISMGHIISSGREGSWKFRWADTHTGPAMLFRLYPRIIGDLTRGAEVEGQVRDQVKQDEQPKVDPRDHHLNSRPVECKQGLQRSICGGKKVKRFRVCF